MIQTIADNEIIEGAKHQLNANFVTLQGETHLALIVPMNLQNDTYAIKRFNEVVRSVPAGNNGQYCIQLVSNIDEPGTILDTTEMLAFKSYEKIVNSILTNSHNYVKTVFNW